MTCHILSPICRCLKLKKDSCLRRAGECFCLRFIAAILSKCVFVCRRRNERPWQRRWVTFNGSELKYFKNKTDKDNLFLNVVELEKMFDVKKVADVSLVGGRKGW